MNTAEVDLDRLVDYEREYRSVVKRAQVTGDHMIGLCPFHDDSKNSFSVDLKTGRWHCFSEDIGGNYVDFVAKMNGISTKDAYKGRRPADNETMENRSHGNRRGTTLHRYITDRCQYPCAGNLWRTI